MSDPRPAGAAPREASPDRPSMLMLSPEAPWPATTGGLVRIGALLDQLADHFDVTFVAPRWPDQVLPDDPRIRLLCPELPRPGAIRRAAALLAPAAPFHVALYTYREIGRLIRRELASRRYDLVFGHFIYSLNYLAGAGARVVIDQQNVDRVYWGNKARLSPFPVNLFAGWNTRKTIAYETRRLAQVWAYVSVSEEDREQTRAYAAPGVRHFWVAPNGVDTGRFVPRGPAGRTARAPLVLGYLGSMDLQMNVDAVQRFCARMLPGIRRRLPAVDVRVLVIGREPSAAIRDLAASTPGMSLSGTVDDVVPWLQRVDVLVCPLRIGAGTKLKVAEAMACGLPVVGTPLAFAGLPGRAGRHFVQAETDEELIDAICALAASPAQRDAIGRDARALTCEHLEWGAIGRRLAADIRRALDGRQP